jgi:ApbE superfamily uncharacterized protein (UPF0280 family)
MKGEGRAAGAYLRRDYRGRMGSRFASFTASFKETDLWIGVDPGSYSGRMEDFAAGLARSLRLELESYISRRPEFLSSLAPIAADPEAPPVAAAMIAAAASAGVGPMAAVAGAAAAFVGEALEREFGCREAIVENGGDLWLLFEEPIDVSVFAGASPLSERVGVTIPIGLSPLGLCTSSGTVGPSLSLGRADAAMVAATSLGSSRDGGYVPGAALADAWATRIGNAVSGPGDIEGALALAEGEETLVSVLLVAGEAMGLRGRLPLKLFASDTGGSP